MEKYLRAGLLVALSVMIASCGSSSKFKEPSASTVQSEVNIFRPTSSLTLTQGVQIAVDDQFIDKMWHGEIMQFNVSQGIHEFETSVCVFGQIGQKYTKGKQGIACKP